LTAPTATRLVPEQCVATVRRPSGEPAFGRRSPLLATGEPVNLSTMRVVLASASPARLAVLRGAGIEPSVVVSEIDESAVVDRLPDADPDELVTTLARSKAQAVRDTLTVTHDDTVIIGCDSMLSFNGETVGKPDTVATAKRRWQAMAGNSGELLTGHAVLHLRGGEQLAAAADSHTTTVHFGTPSDHELDSYLATGEPLHVAGGFTLEGFGGWFIDGIDGDPSSVTGISLPLTRRLLSRLDIRVTDLWNTDSGVNGAEPRRFTDTPPPGEQH